MGRVHALQVASDPDGPVEIAALDGDIARVEFDRTPDASVPRAPACRFSCGLPVVPDFVPTRMRWSHPRGHAIPDFDRGLILNVSGRGRGLIEALEPAVHQFLAVTYHDRDGQWLEQRYFLIPCRRIDSVDLERSDLDPGAAEARAETMARSRIVFSLRRIGRTHLWHDTRLADGPFISEALAKALQASGMTGLGWDDGFPAF
jgi:hypothetical protein